MGALLGGGGATRRTSCGLRGNLPGRLGHLFHLLAESLPEEDLRQVVGRIVGQAAGPSSGRASGPVCPVRAPDDQEATEGVRESEEAAEGDQTRILLLRSLPTSSPALRHFEFVLILPTSAASWFFIPSIRPVGNFIHDEHEPRKAEATAQACLRHRRWGPCWPAVGRAEGLPVAAGRPNGMVWPSVSSACGVAA